MEVSFALHNTLTPYIDKEDGIVHAFGNKGIIIKCVRQVGPYLPQALSLEGISPQYERIRRD